MMKNLFIFNGKMQVMNIQLFFRNGFNYDIMLLLVFIIKLLFVV